MADVTEDALAKLRMALEPMGPERTEQLLKLARNELEHGSIVQTAFDKDGNPYTLGETSPTLTDHTIFALFEEDANFVCVYAAKIVDVPQGKAIVYARERIEASYVSGQISPDALYQDLLELLAPDDDAPRGMNGAAHAARN